MSPPNSRERKKSQQRVLAPQVRGGRHALSREAMNLLPLHPRSLLSWHSALENMWPGFGLSDCTMLIQSALLYTGLLWSSFRLQNLPTCCCLHVQFFPLAVLLPATLLHRYTINYDTFSPWARQLSPLLDSTSHKVRINLGVLVYRCTHFCWIHTKGSSCYVVGYVYI